MPEETTDKKTKGNDLAEIRASMNEKNTGRSNSAEPLRAVGETLNRLTGSLTGQSVEQKVQEYTSVYGEILLAMHSRLNDLDRENRTLRKEQREQRRRIQALEKPDRTQPGPHWIAVLALILSLGMLAWQIWRLTKG